MKKMMLIEIIRKLKSRPDLMRKAKIFAFVGLFGFLITGALAIWAGITAFNYVANQATAVVQSNAVQMNIESLKTDIKAGPQFQALGCWNKAQNLFAIEPWLQRPALENLAQLKAACFKERPMQTTEGSKHDSSKI